MTVLKNKVNKQPAPKVAASNIQEIQTNLDKEYSEARIKQLEDKLKERDETIAYQKLDYDKLQKEFDLYKKNSNLKADGIFLILYSLVTLIYFNVLYYRYRFMHKIQIYIDRNLHFQQFRHFW
jgi:hypothetical protein